MQENHDKYQSEVNEEIPEARGRDIALFYVLVRGGVVSSDDGRDEGRQQVLHVEGVRRVAPEGGSVEDPPFKIVIWGETRDETRDQKIESRRERVRMEESERERERGRERETETERQRQRERGRERERDRERERKRERDRETDRQTERERERERER
jgi:hypothetical protein